MSDGLRAEHLSFAYGTRPVLRDVSLDVGRGEAVALLGANGSGKSTLLHLLSGTLAPDTGLARWGGEDIAFLARRVRAQRIALLPQVFQVSFAFTCRELVALARTPYIASFGHEGARDHAAVARALELTGTSALAERSVLELSGGERQRVLIALALAQEPELLLLDEPTAQLDAAHQVALLGLVLELARRSSLTVVATLHDLNLAALFFERIAVLHDGRIVADGAPSAVLTQDLVRRVYDAEAHILRHPTYDVPLVAFSRPPDDAGALL